MGTARVWSVATSILILSLVSCNEKQPLDPLDAALVGGVKPPTATSARPTSSSDVLVTWTDNAPNEDGFRIERSATTGGPWTVATTTGTGVTSFADAQRPAEQQVCYRVIALRKSNQSSPSNTACTAPPAAPDALTATRIDDQTVQLAWTDKSAVEDGYEVQRATTQDGPYSIVAAALPANTVGYRDGGLSPSAYWYRVRAKKDGGFGNFSGLAVAPHPAAPKAPSGTNVVPGGSNWVTITWIDNATNETGFRVERSPDLVSPWIAVVTIYGQDVTTTTSYVASEQQVCYRVIAFNALAESTPSTPDCTTPPAAPSGLTATVIDYQTVNLAWTDNSLVEDGYEVQRARQGDNWATVADLPANSKSYRDVAASDATYWYMVRAKKDGGYSYNSNAVQVILVSTAPAAPSGVNATPDGSTGAFVTWLDNSPNEEGFRIERSTDGMASWSLAGTTGSSITWFAEGGLTTERQVCYRVLAFNVVGSTLSSDSDCTTPPAAPANLVATAVGSDAIALSWTDNGDVTKTYEVQRVFCYYDYYGFPYCDYSPIATLGAGTTSYTDTGLNPGETYTYRVLTLKDGGYSDPSNEASATTNVP